LSIACSLAKTDTNTLKLSHYNLVKDRQPLICKRPNCMHQIRPRKGIRYLAIHCTCTQKNIQNSKLGPQHILC